MKKLLIVALCLIFAICFTSCTGKTGPTGPAGTDGKDGLDFREIPSNATILTNETFDSYAPNEDPTGWFRNLLFLGTEVWYEAKPTNFTSYPNCLQIDTAGTNFEREIVKAPMLPIPNKTSGKLFIKFNVSCQYNTKNREFLFYLNQIEKVRVKFANDGIVYAYSDNYATFTRIGTYTPYIWNQVLIVLDLSVSKYEVYFDGILKASNLTCLIQVERHLNETPISYMDSLHRDFFGLLTNIDATYSDHFTMLDDVIIYYVP